MDKSLPSISATPAANSQSKKRSAIVRPRPLPLALEARLMFDGAAVAATVETMAAEPTSDTTQASDIVVPEALPTQATRNEIAFVDTSVNNWSAMVASLGNTVEVVTLDGTTDGLSQIANSLQGRSGLDAIHIISHGSAGNLQLSGVDYTAESIGRSYSRLQEIGQALAANGDILLYGCDIGQGSAGQALIDAIASITAADVAASSDATGAATAGGDWNLEAASGPVEASSLSFSDEVNPGLLGTPSVTSVDDRSYTEGQGAVIVDSNITVTGGGSYDGKYVRFSLTNGQTTDVLTLTNAANVNASGAISFSGTSVYLGNGSGRDIIGSIDATEDGTAGKALKINFVSSFTNASFESGNLTGWTAINDVINLGTTSIAGFTSPNDGTYPANAGNDDAYPSTKGSYSSTISASQYTDGSKSLQLLSENITTASGYDVIHGPAVYSDAFSATAGDKIYFDWRAYAGGDAYDVFGYILNTATEATTTVLDATGSSTSGSSNWATANVTIPTTGSYRFVFVSGTYDYSGGRAAGASLYIDNVRVYGSKVNDAVVTSIARQVAFNATSDNPVTASTRIFTVTAMSSDGATGSDTGLITVSATNDAPVLGGAVQTISYTENGVAKVIDAAITVADPDQPANLNNGWLQVQITANGATEDQLSIINQGTGAGQIGVSGSNVTYGGTLIGTIDATANGVNNAALRINLNISATTTAVQALARQIAYQNTSETPSTASRTATFTLNDGGNTGSGGALQGTRTATINVTAVDDPSVLTLSSASKTYDENDNSYFVDPSLTLIDVDSATINGARVVVSSNFRSAEDRLYPDSGTDVSGKITYSFNTTTGILTLTGTATIAEYQAALRAVKYQNLSENPDTATRSISITIGNAVALTINGTTHYYEYVSGSYTWAQAKTAAEALTFQGLTGYLATITSQTENDFIKEKLQADAWIGASDDYIYINAATGTTTFANQTASEGKWYWVTGPEKGTLISTGNGSPVTATNGYAYWNNLEPNNSGSNEHYGEIYSSGASPGKWNDLPNSSTLPFVVEYSDNSSVSSFSKSINITPVRKNDAPVNNAPNAIPSITEDAISNSGSLISSFLSATDADGNALGVAVTAVDNSGGAWQYSTDGGATWLAFGAPSDSAARLLRSTDKVRFVPNANFAGTATIEFRAWDRTTGTVGSTADLSNPNSVGAFKAVTNGDETAYSATKQTATLTVTAVNDAPLLTPASPALTGISEDDTSNDGQTVASMLGSSVSDVDASALKGIAITALTSGNGTWQYDTGSGWTNIGTVSASSALLLRATDSLRFVPDGKNATTGTVSFKAWDQTSGSPGSKVSTATSGGTSAFSTASDTASISVSAVNDAPVLGTPANLTGISEDATNNAGQTIASFLGSSLTDSDNGALQGIAITGASNGGATGTWQYSTDGGSTWHVIGTPDASTALLLKSTDLIRFNPDGYQGGTPTLKLRGWDQSSGTASNGATRGTADVSTNGGTTAFSSAEKTVSLSVSELNDAPRFDTPASASSFTENSGTAAVVGTALVLVDDGGNLSKATVSISAGFTAGDTLAVGTPGGLTVNYNSATGVLTLSGTASAATYQAALRSVTFTTASEDPTVNSATRTLTWKATDTSGLVSTASNSTSTLSITPLADAPVLAGTAALAYTEDDGARVLAPLLTLSDVDDTQMAGAVVRLSGTGLDKAVEYLSLRGAVPALNGGAYEWSVSNVMGYSGVTATYAWNSGSNSGVLTISGLASTAAYQQILRSVSYTSLGNYTADPDTTATVGTRSVNWQVIDANSDNAGSDPVATFLGSGTGNGTLSNPLSQTITIAPANDAPVLSGLSGTPVSYTEGPSSVTLASGITLADIDDANLTQAKVWISGGFTAGDTLSANAGSTGITVSYASATGILTLSHAGASKADFESVLRTVTFSSTADDPTAISPSRSISWQVTDADSSTGAANKLVSNLGTTQIDLTASDDGASISGLASAAFTENGSPVVVAPSATLADVDDTTLSGLTVTISSGLTSGDLLSVGANLTGTGITVTAFNSGTGQLVLSGTASLADYTKALNSIVFTSSSENPTATSISRTFTWSTTSSFASRTSDAPAGNDSDSGTVTASAGSNTLTITARNDAPSLALDFNTVLDGTAVVFQQGGSPIYVLDSSDPNTIGSATLSDIDDSNMASASVVISGNRATDNTDTLSVATPAGWTLDVDTLTLTAPGGGTVTVAFDASTGTLTLITASGSVSKAEYETLLEHVQYQNSSLSPTASGASRELTWTVTDAAGDGAGSATGKSYMVIRDKNDAPIIAPTTGTVTYTEGDLTVALPDIVVTDVDPDEIVTATLTLDKVAAGTLSVPTGASYNPATGVWTISGSVADVNTALAALTFTPATNNDQNAKISISVADGGEDAATVASGTIKLNVTAVNDAPVLTARHPVLAQLTEDETSNGGMQVSAFRGEISDVDSSFARGIAITAQDAGNGKWQYQIGGNSGSWTDFGTVSDASALVLADADFICFVPNAENATTAGLTYRGWDGSGTVTAQRMDATASGGNTPFSTASDEVSLVVTDVNDAPVLTAAGKTLNGITEDDIDNAGQTVSDLLGTVRDVDTGATGGVAIFGQDDGNGTWQFRIDGTSTWNDFGTVSSSSALLLSSADHIRFVPNGLNTTTANFSFRAWDQTSGTAGSKADASLTGGTTPFSTTSDTASLTVVDAVNDAPVMTPASPTLVTITEDENNNAGQTVASFLGSSISDVDNSALQGIAITDTTVGNGHWEYSIDANIWIAFPSISESTALLLRDTDRIRFVPDRMNGTTATLTYRAWDRTTVAGAGSRTDAGTNGGTTAFSALTDTATLTVTPVNDAPINDTLPTRIGAERANGTLRQIATAGSTAGVWRDVDIGDPATRITYQWQIADDASGNGLRDISGATASTYVISPDFVGKFLRLKVMGSDNDSTTNVYTGFTEITNIDPSATMALVDQKTTESVPITFTVPTAAFSDPDVSKGEDSFTYSAKLADGSPLPAWLTFDPLTLTFSGTPSGADVGVLAVSVFASDGGNFPASITFNLTVLSLPSNPQPASPLPPAELPPSNAAGIFLVPAPTIPGTTAGTVTDGGSGAASGSIGSPTLYAGTATSIDAGVGQPGGFNLGGGTGGFGLPSGSDSGAGGSPFAMPGMERNSGMAGSGGDSLPKGILTAPGDGAFRVVVTQSDQPSLMVYRGISEAAVQREGGTVQLQIPADAFTHTNPMAVITLSARLSDGAPLPAWLKFDQASGKLVGTPPADFSGVIEVEVTARDDDGREARVIFKIKGASRIQLGHPGLSEQIRLASRPASSFDLGKATGLAQRLREPTRITT